MCRSCVPPVIQTYLTHLYYFPRFSGCSDQFEMVDPTSQEDAGRSVDGDSNSAIDKTISKPESYHWGQDDLEDPRTYAEFRDAASESGSVAPAVETVQLDKDDSPDAFADGLAGEAAWHQVDLDTVDHEQSSAAPMLHASPEAEDDESDESFRKKERELQMNQPGSGWHLRQPPRLSTEELEELLSKPEGE